MIEESVLFEVETETSDNTIAAVLTQGGRPVTFYSRTLQGSERHHAAMEDRRSPSSRDFATGGDITCREDTLTSKPTSVMSYMFDKQHKNNIKER